MAKQVIQYRYYGDGNSNNYPNDLKAANLGENGSLFAGKIIKQIGIQTIPGVKFYINAGKYPIEIGSTGVYELSLNNLVDITQLSFTKDSLAMIDGIGYLIIDILYEEGNS